MPNAALRYEFATRQWIDVFGDWEQSMHELLAQIALAFPPEEAAPIVREMPKLEPVPQAQASQPVVKPVSGARQEKFAFAGKPYVIGGAALVLLLVAGGAFIFLRTPPQAPQRASAAQTQAQIEPAQTQMDKGNASLYPAQPAQPQAPAQPAKKTAARQPAEFSRHCAIPVIRRRRWRRGGTRIGNGSRKCEGKETLLFERMISRGRCNYINWPPHMGLQKQSWPWVSSTNMERACNRITARRCSGIRKRRRRGLPQSQTAKLPIWNPGPNSATAAKRASHKCEQRRSG